MTEVFADSYYFFAILNPRDDAHSAAIAFSAEQSCTLVTTTPILLEVADGLSHPRHRNSAAKLLRKFGSGSHNVIIHPSSELFEDGVCLYERMQDKDWSLTDCISIVVMQKRGIRAAWTGDKHFRQAGFDTLAPT